MANELTVEQLQQLYHLRLEDAAKRLGMGAAKLKKQCRLLGIQRWKYRQVSSKLLRIQHLCKFMAHTEDQNEKQRIQAKIHDLSQEYLDIVGGHVPNELQLSAEEAAVLASERQTMMSTKPSNVPINEDLDLISEDEEFSDEPEAETATEDNNTDELSAYSLRFILDDCSILDTDSGVQLSR